MKKTLAKWKINSSCFILNNKSLQCLPSIVPLLLLTLFFLLNACQKETSQLSFESDSNQLIRAKVDSWLNKEKTSVNDSKKSNIELLKNNLDFLHLRVEQSEEKEQIIVIPVKDEFKKAKHVDNNKIPNLVLIVDKSGNIRKGNLVLYIPKSGEVATKVPNNTFYDIYNNATPDCNGQFRFLSVAGSRLYQLDYENGKLTSFGYIQKGKNPNQIITNVGDDCIDWFLITTYYYPDGSTYQTEEYVGRTCGNNECEDVECLDPGSGGGGGGGTGGEYTSVIAQTNWNVYSAGAWFVKSTESFTGMRKITQTSNGYFTGITHNGSLMNAPGNLFMTWLERGAVTNYLFNQANIIISGTIRHEAQDPNERFTIEVDNHHQPFFFSLLNWQ